MLDESRERIDKFIDRFLIWGSLVGAMVFGVLLLQEDLVMSYFLNINKSEFKEVGRIVKAKNDVRRRMGQSLTWYQVSTNEKLFERDSVFTGEESEIAFQILDGEEINLSSESLVVIETKNNEIYLDLKVGSLATNTSGNKKVNIVHEGQVARLESTGKAAVQITKAKSGGLKITSQSNEVQLMVGTKKESIKKNEELDIDNESIVTRKTYTTTITSHEEYSKIWQMKGESVLLTWKNDEPTSQLKLQISKSKTFSKKIVDSIVPNESWTWFPDSAQGTYFLRLANAVNNEPVSITHRIDIRNRGRVLLVVPEDRKKLFPEFEMKRSDVKTVKFSWNEKTDADYYDVNISKNSEFSDEVQKLKVETNKMSVDLSQGVYFWRVRSVESKSGEHVWSDIREFEVGKAAPIMPVQENVPDAANEPVASLPYGPEKPNIPYGPEKPELVAQPETPSIPYGPEKPVVVAQPETPSIPYGPEKPAVVTQPETPAVPVVNNAPELISKNQKIILDFNPNTDFRSPASVMSNLKNPPHLKWQPMANVAEYEIQMDTTKEFNSEKLKVVKANTNTYEWKDISPGQYYWRVRSAGSPDAIFSETNLIQAEVKAPEFSPVSLPAEIITDPKLLDVKKKVLLKWKSAPLATAYRITSDGNSNDVDETEVDVTLAPNLKKTYNIVALNEHKEIISAASSINLSYKRELKIDQPQIRLPANDTTIVAFDSSQVDPIVFMWTPTANIENYELQYAKDSQFKQVLKTEKISDTKFVLKEALYNGKVYWRVRGQYKKYNSPWSDVRTYVVQVVN
jgi:hypothetical protein